MLTIKPSDGIQILGDNFFRGYHIIYDYDSPAVWLYPKINIHNKLVDKDIILYNDDYINSFDIPIIENENHDNSQL